MRNNWLDHANGPPQLVFPAPRPTGEGRARGRRLEEDFLCELGKKTRPTRRIFKPASLPYFQNGDDTRSASAASTR